MWWKVSMHAAPEKWRTLAGRKNGSMYRKDFLLHQMNQFFEALAKIALKIDARQLEAAEQDIQALLHTEMVTWLTQEDDAGAAPADYDTLRFQTELLLKQLAIEKIRNSDKQDVLRTNCIRAIKKLMSLKKDAYDMAMGKTLQDLEQGKV